MGKREVGRLARKGKKEIRVSIDAEKVDWLDEKINKNHIWAHRTHAIGRLIQMAQKREERGEDLTELR